MEDFLASLQVVLPDQEDKWSWALESNSEFSVKSTYCLLIETT
jgi:hypothetical protein